MSFPPSNSRPTSPSPSSKASTRIASPVSAPPRAREIDYAKVKGNTSLKDKKFFWEVFSYFVDPPRGGSYGVEVGQRLKLLEINVWDGASGDGVGPCPVGAGGREGGLGLRGEGNRDESKMYAQSVFEIVVEEDMCNVYGTLHGACAAYIVDPCSSSALVLLGYKLSSDGRGVSLSMNLQWHRPVKAGTTLRVISTSISFQSRVRTARCELWDGDQLCISAMHTTTNARKKDRARL